MKINLTNVLLDIWNDTRNFCIIKKTKNLKKIQDDFKLKFKFNKNKEIINVIFDKMIKVMEVLTLNDHVLKKLKKYCMKAFYGKKKIFPTNFFYEFEIDCLKISYYGFT